MVSLAKRIDGHNLKEILTSIEKAKAVQNKPVCIIAETVEGKGVSFMENIRVWHGKTPDNEQYDQAIREVME